MKEILALLKQRSSENWLVGYDSQEFYDSTQKLSQEFGQLSAAETPAKIILAETHPIRFLTAFLAAIVAKCPVFLGNPHWAKPEWQEVLALVQPDLILGTNLNLPAIEEHYPVPIAKKNPQPHQIMIPTGGSSGKIKFAIHTWLTLTAAVRGLQQYFDCPTINSYCILPLYHVSGLMQFLRSFLTGGKIFITPYQTLKLGELGTIDPQSYFLSVVPTQLQFLLTKYPHWLAQFQTVFLGGAPAWSSLLDKARKYQIRLAPTYGMTETAAQVVTLKPADFLAGNNSSGQVLPHAQVTIDREQGDKLKRQQQGIITIESQSLCLGYYPELVTDRLHFTTDDLGFFDVGKYLYIVGRNSQTIITGGEKVVPTEVEAAILATNLVQDVCVVGLPDEKWGQVVTAMYLPLNEPISPAQISQNLLERLSKFKLPKYWLRLEHLPRNQQGKIDRSQVEAIAFKKQQKR